MYFGQLGLWIGIILVTKLIMFSLNIIFNTVFVKIGNWILSPLSAYPRMKLVIVMVIVPIVCDVIQFWIFDNLLKFKFNNETDINILQEAVQSSEELNNVVKNNEVISVHSYNSEQQSIDSKVGLIKDSTVEDIVTNTNSVDSKEALL